MSSLEVLANGQLESFDSSEFSLIPEQPPLDTEEAALNHPVNGQLDVSNMPSAFRSATLDLSVEEIQARLVELVEDNETMKEALKLNNTMMKEQLSTISAWHNQMTTSMSQQQMSLTEAKTRVNELEQENVELSRKVEELQTNPKTVVDSVTCTREDNIVASDEETDFEIIGERKNSKDDELLKNQLKDASVKIADLQKEIDRQKSEIIQLKKNSEDKVLEIGSLQRDLKHHNELKQRSESLLQEIADYQTNTKIVHVLDEAKVKSLESKCEQLQKKVNKYKSLEQPETSPKENLMSGMESKVKELEEKLMKEQQASQAERLRHAETIKLLAVLQSNYDRVTKLLQAQSKVQSGKNEQDTEYEMQTRQFLEQIDSLTAKLFDMEQTLEERETKVKEITSELNTLKEDSETIPILKAQVEVYKTDLNSTMLARDSAHEEVERLTKQMQDMQPGASFCVNCGAGADAASRNKGRRKPHLSRQPESPQLIICPVCQFGFTDLQAAENHVNNCIDKAQ